MVNPQLHPGKFTRMPKMMVCKRHLRLQLRASFWVSIYPSLKLTVRPWKMVVGIWKMILSYWEVVTFQGPNFVQLREGIGLYIQFPVRVDPPVSPVIRFSISICTFQSCFGQLQGGTPQVLSMCHLTAVRWWWWSEQQEDGIPRWVDTCFVKGG